MVRFHDLNIPRHKHIAEQKKTLKLAHKLGYEVVAVTDFLCDPKKLRDLPPAWKKIDLGPGTSELQQLSRITMVLKLPSEITVMNMCKVKEYDIVAVQPTTVEAMQIASTNVNVDVISLDLTKLVYSLIRHNYLKIALDNGKMLEVSYSPALKDSSTRREFFRNVNVLCEMDHARGVIVTSMANTAAELRGPYDVANLGLLFGLNEGQAKQAISSNCRALLVKAATRRNTVKSSITVKHVNEIPKKDRWTIQNDDSIKRPAAEEEETKSIKKHRFL